MRTIEVYPNPHIALDADGVPQGVVGHPGAPGSWIGAQLDLESTLRTGKQRFYFPPGKNGGKFRVPLISDIVSAVQAGELIAASKEDAHVCGVREEYLEPEKALAAEREKALAYYRSVRGPAAELKDVPREPAKAPEEPGAKPATATASAVVSPNLKLAKSKE